jgi:hypothetical protein
LRAEVADAALFGAAVEGAKPRAERNRGFFAEAVNHHEAHPAAVGAALGAGDGGEAEVRLDEAIKLLQERGASGGVEVGENVLGGGAEKINVILEAAEMRAAEQGVVFANVFGIDDADDEFRAARMRENQAMAALGKRRGVLEREFRHDVPFVCHAVFL